MPATGATIIVFGKQPAGEPLFPDLPMQYFATLLDHHATERSLYKIGVFLQPDGLFSCRNLREMRETKIGGKE